MKQEKIVTCDEWQDLLESGGLLKIISGFPIKLKKKRKGNRKIKQQNKTVSDTTCGI